MNPNPVALGKRQYSKMTYCLVEAACSAAGDCIKGGVHWALRAWAQNKDSGQWTSRPDVLGLVANWTRHVEQEGSRRSRQMRVHIKSIPDCVLESGFKVDSADFCHYGWPEFLRELHLNVPPLTILTQ